MGVFFCLVSADVHLLAILATEASLPSKRLAALNRLWLIALLAAECFECAVSHFYRSIFGALAIGCDVGGVGGEQHYFIPALIM